MVNRLLLTIYIILFFFLLGTPGYALEADEIDAPYPLTAQETKLEGVVTKILEERTEEQFGLEHIVQELEVSITSDDQKGETLHITNGEIATVGTRIYKENDTVIVSHIIQPDGTDLYFILDYVRRGPLFALFGLFVFVTVLVAGQRGFASLLGMAYSFFIIVSFILPQIASGQNPIIVALIGGFVIVPVTFYISHGFNAKTHTSIVGTIIALFITGLLAWYTIDWTHLTGFATEDASLLQVTSDGSINIKGLLLAGIIVGLFGILDDITVSQAAIVYKLKETSKGLGFFELYRKSMDIGKDHIGSLINTLVLVYTGAALPFILLLTQGSESFWTTINYELIAEEIVRTLTASIGLILAVPITSLLASYWASKKH